MASEMIRDIVLKLKQEPEVPVEAETINPENLQGKTRQEIGKIPLWYGKSQVPLAEFFDVELHTREAEPSAVEESAAGDRPDLFRVDLPQVSLFGNLKRFKRLGQGMGAGSMTVYGNVGFHAGAFMRGGQLTIEGNAADWLGALMTGGDIFVRGSAGNYAGAAYHGYPQGMKGGRIFIKGDAGIMLGARLRRGLILVQGRTGDLPGYALHAGTIVIGRKPGSRVGANMVRGTIVLLESPETFLPTFYENCTYQPSFWRCFYSSITKLGFLGPAKGSEAKFRRLTGDANEGGKGEILLWENEA